MNRQKRATETEKSCCHLHSPEPLRSLTSETTAQFKLFLQNIYKYNSCFQMTSFGTINIVQETGYVLMFIMQRPIDPQAGSLLPEPSQNPKILQILFMGSLISGVETCSALIVKSLRHYNRCSTEKKNHLVRIFQNALELMLNND